MAGIDSLQVTINRQLCIGDGICCQCAPGTFRLTEDGQACVCSETGDERATVVEAAANCRMDAITVLDGATGEQLVPCKVP